METQGDFALMFTVRTEGHLTVKLTKCGSPTKNGPPPRAFNSQTCSHWALSNSPVSPHVGAVVWTVTSVLWHIEEKLLGFQFVQLFLVFFFFITNDFWAPSMPGWNLEVAFNIFFIAFFSYSQTGVICGSCGHQLLFLLIMKPHFSPFLNVLYFFTGQGM